MPLLLQHLITFCRVVEAGSFTRAAHLLNLSQPSVTKHVSGLEAEIGMQLLDREGKRIHLTPAGELVYAYAKRIHQAVSECQTALMSLRSPDAGQVTLGCVHTIAFYVLPDLLAAFARLYPQVRLIVRTATIQVTLSLLLQHDVDIGLVTSPVSHERVVCVPLFDDPVLVVGAPEPRFPIPDALTLADLGRLPILGYERGSRFRNFVDALLEQFGIPNLNVVMEFDSHEAVKTMAGLGLGLALVPASAVKADLEEGRLVELKVQGLPQVSRTTSLILRREGRLSPGAVTLSRFIADRFNVHGDLPL